MTNRLRMSFTSQVLAAATAIVAGAVIASPNLSEANTARLVFCQAEKN